MAHASIPAPAANGTTPSRFNGPGRASRQPRRGPRRESARGATTYPRMCGADPRTYTTLRFRSRTSEAEQASHVRGLARVLEPVVRDAHEAHAECDGRVPATVDDPVEVPGRESLEHRPHTCVHRVEVLDERVGALRPDRSDLVGPVTVAGVRRIWFEPEAAGPLTA